MREHGEKTNFVVGVFATSLSIQLYFLFSMAASLPLDKGGISVAGLSVENGSRYVTFSMSVLWHLSSFTVIAALSGGYFKKVIEVGWLGWLPILALDVIPLPSGGILTDIALIALLIFVEALWIGFYLSCAGFRLAGISIGIVLHFCCAFAVFFVCLAFFDLVVGF